MVAIKGSLSVSLENGSTKSANNSFPRFAVEGNIAKSRLCHHVCHAGTAAAPRAGSRRRLAPPHLPFLIHEKAEANHTAVSTNTNVVTLPFLPKLICLVLSFNNLASIIMDRYICRLAEATIQESKSWIYSVSGKLVKDKVEPFGLEEEYCLLLSCDNQTPQHPISMSKIGEWVCYGCVYH